MTFDGFLERLLNKKDSAVVNIFVSILLFRVLTDYSTSKTRERQLPEELGLIFSIENNTISKIDLWKNHLYAFNEKNFFK